MIRREQSWHLPALRHTPENAHGLRHHGGWVAGVSWQQQGGALLGNPFEGLQILLRNPQTGCLTAAIGPADTNIELCVQELSSGRSDGVL